MQVNLRHTAENLARLIEKPKKTICVNMAEHSLATTAGELGEVHRMGREKITLEMILSMTWALAAAAVIRKKERVYPVTSVSKRTKDRT